MNASWRPGWPSVCTVAAILILAAPIWCVTLPAMPDLPAHLAGFDLIAGAAGHAPLSNFYRIEWAFIPNLGSEVLVPFLSNFMPLATGVKVFLSVGLAMWVLGPAAIHRVLYGRIGLAPLFAAFFAYNANFMWGFVNYYFAAGLSFLVFAAWIASEGRPLALRLSGFAMAATAIYFCHLFAAATLFVLLGCYELASLWQSPGFSWKDAVRRCAMVGAIFVPSAIAYLILKPAGAGGGRLEFNLIDTFLDRVGSAIQYGFDNPAYLLPAALLALLAAGVWRGKVVLHPKLTLILVALGIGTLVAPEWAIGGWALDLRLPAVFGVFLFAAADIRLATRAELALAATAMLLFICGAVGLAGNWLYFNRQFGEFRQAMAATPPGIKLMTVLDGDALGLASDPPYWHMAEFAIIDRSDFTPLMFTTEGQHVVRLQPAVENIAATTAQQGSPPDVDELDALAGGRMDEDEDLRDEVPYLIYFPCHYDEAIVIHLGGHRTVVPPMLRLRHAGSFFSIYDILRPGDCAKS